MPEPGQPRLLIFDSEFKLLRFDPDGGTRFVLLGDVDAGGAGRVLKALEAEMVREGGVELMLEEAELTDAISVARMVDAVRLLVGRHAHVRLIRSPQLLAHSLYRVGMIREGAPLKLIEPREEEGSAS
jgi:hypothetical protein